MIDAWKKFDQAVFLSVLKFASLALSMGLGHKNHM